MGRSLFWFIVPREISHDTTKKLCMNLEFEPEKDEINELIYKQVHPEDVIDYEQSPVNYSAPYLYHDIHSKDWCPKCKMFASGLYDSELLVRHTDVQHNNQNPIWSSDWNIKGFHLGSSTTDFVRRFDNDRMYREISKSDVEDAYDRIDRLGNCFRSSDKEAKEEAMQVLDWLRTYADDETVRMLMDDNY
jgi:hypothetical protein